MYSFDIVDIGPALNLHCVSPIKLLHNLIMVEH